MDYSLAEAAEVVKIIMEVLVVQADRVVVEPVTNLIMAQLELLILEAVEAVDQEPAAAQPGLVVQVVQVSYSLKLQVHFPQDTP